MRSSANNRQKKEEVPLSAQPSTRRQFPRSKENAGRLAPPEKVGMYMGSFYWCAALGNLFGGVVTGVAYQLFGPEGINRPECGCCSRALP